MLDDARNIKLKALQEISKTEIGTLNNPSFIKREENVRKLQKVEISKEAVVAKENKKSDAIKTTENVSKDNEKTTEDLSYIEDLLDDSDESIDFEDLLVSDDEICKLDGEDDETEEDEDGEKSYEELRKDGELDFDFEVEKGILIAQSYPCLNYKITSYLPLLKRKVIGQDKVLEKLTYIAYYNQYVNFLEEYLEDMRFKRKSMLLIAPTGWGKSTMMRALERAFDVPVYRANITATTSAGYIGEKVESLILSLINRAGGDIASAERGILFIDEIDKKIVSSTHERDVAGKAVQQELLKLFEDGTINLASLSKDALHPLKGEFHTGSLTIVMAGACVGLDEIRKKRLRATSGIGFKAKADDGEEEENLEYTSEDLIQFGFIPELVGRIDTIQELEPYTPQKLVDIVYFSDESSMLEHVKILESLGVNEVMIDPLLWEKIAEQILSSKLGVRELNNMISKLFYPIIYEAFQHSNKEGYCTIDSDGNYTLRYESENKTYTGKSITLKKDPLWDD